MISAPRSARTMLPYGPAPYCSTAITRTSERGAIGACSEKAGLIWVFTLSLLARRLRTHARLPLDVWEPERAEDGPHSRSSRRPAGAAPARRFSASHRY